MLLTGRSPASKAVGELLLALRGTGSARISPPWCADCGREVTSMQRRSGNWYCSPCFERPEPCSACGQLRPVGFRDRHGGPRCAKCPDKDTRDPHHVLVDVITTIDAGLTESAVTAAIAKTAVKAAHVQKLAWTLEEAPELLTTDGAKAPAPMVLRLIDALCDAGATVVRRPACPRCERVVALSKTRDGQRICRNCAAKANAVPCARCGTIREPATRDEHGKPLCPNCLVSDPVNLESCIRCRRRRRVHLRSPDGPVCGTCTPRTTAVCSMCGRTAPCTTSKTTGRPRCGACARAWAPCSRCGRSAPVRAGTREQPLCAECAVPDPGIWRTCPGCGTTGRIVAGACSRCRLHQQLHALLTDTDGQIRPGLQPLHRTLADTNRPTTALNWLKHPTIRATLAELARGDRPLTHTALDELTPSKPIEHLRSMLVATEILPARDEHFARIERWVTRTLDQHPRSDDKELLNRYAHWHLLRRLRRRTRGAATTYGQLDVIRQRVRAAIGLLDWLHSRGLTLTSCRQSDLDLWLTSADANHRAEVGHFVRWAISQRLNHNLRFAATRWNGPAGPLDHEERWHQAKRLLHDGTIDTADRVAGLFLLLYAQRLATISRLTVDDIETNGAAIDLRFGSVPITMPEPLSALITDLITTRRSHAVLAAGTASPWLFPGGQPGRPISADRLGARLRALGLRPAQARSTALFQLATELPAAVLARLLGIHINVAVQWQQHSAGDWTNYAADLSRRPDNR
ncbi:phage integrase family protein [Rhodococcus sp. IEGM 248]|nr:phage integrase family protein [Rhodococcus sp. IEGM 248]